MLLANPLIVVCEITSYTGRMHSQNLWRCMEKAVSQCSSSLFVPGPLELVPRCFVVGGVKKTEPLGRFWGFFLMLLL